MPNDRCPYCDTDADEIDGPLDEHALDCQPWGLELSD